MGKFYKHAKAYLLTGNADLTTSEIANKLHEIGFNLGKYSVEEMHAQYGAWLTSHGLDIQRSDLDQQALINDHAAIVRRIIKLDKTGSKKNVSEIDALKHQLSDAGIYILDVKRLERCLSLTKEKAKLAEKQQAKRKRAGAKYRATSRTEEDTTTSIEAIDLHDDIIDEVVLCYACSIAEAEQRLDELIIQLGGDPKHYDVGILRAAEVQLCG